MLRIAYTIAAITLIGASAFAGSRIDDRRESSGRGVGLVLLVSLQR